MAQKKINIRLLRKVQKHILQEPRRYDQNDIVCRLGAEEVASNSALPPCGTVACIGGWAYLLSVPLKKQRPEDDELTIAAQKLGLDGLQRGRLFSGIGYGAWPAKFDMAYREAKTTRGRARVAARRIDHFIKTNGAE